MTTRSVADQLLGLAREYHLNRTENLGQRHRPAKGPLLAREVQEHLIKSGYFRPESVAVFADALEVLLQTAQPKYVAKPKQKFGEKRAPTMTFEERLTAAEKEVLKTPHLENKIK